MGWKDLETRRKYEIDRRIKHPEIILQDNASKRRNYQERRRQALEKVGRGAIKCVRCGMDDIRILEINHINGDGRKEYGVRYGGKRYLKGGMVHMYRNIVFDKRAIDDLEILCKVCNAIHYVKFKYGIDWEGK